MAIIRQKRVFWRIHVSSGWAMEFAVETLCVSTDKCPEQKLDGLCGRKLYMTLLEWAMAGAVVIWGVVISLRIVRKGISSLDDDRGELLERIKGEEKRIREDKKNISAREQMDLTQAAIRDLLSLDGHDHANSLAVEKDRILLHVSGKIFSIELIMNECRLKSVRRVLHGRCKWRINWGKTNALFDDIGELMKFLHQQLQGHEEQIFLQDPFSSHLHGGRPEKAGLPRQRSNRHAPKKQAERRRPANPGITLRGRFPG